MLNAFPQYFVLVIPAAATFVVHDDVPSTSRRLRLQEYRCLDYYNSYLLCKVKGHLHETYCFPAHFFQDFTTTRMFTKIFTTMQYVYHLEDLLNCIVR